MQSKRVLAVDPGFDRLGVAIVARENGKEKLLYSECIQTNVRDKRPARLLAIGQGLKKLIKDWEPDDLAIESLFFNQNTTSAIGVAEARGIVMFVSSSAGLEVYEYSPQAIKIAVTGYGKATKQQVNTMVRRLIKIEDDAKKLDDEVDAIALGITHLASKKDF